MSLIAKTHTKSQNEDVQTINPMGHLAFQAPTACLDGTRACKQNTTVFLAVPIDLSTAFLEIIGG